MNAFDFAMEMEDAGRTYYENLATTASLPGLETIFRRLAEDEAKHYEIFRALKAGGKFPNMTDSTILETARNVFVELPRDVEEMQDMSGVLVAYKHAMKLETDSFHLYEDAAAKEADAGIRGLLLKIAGEEHKHYNILENIYNFVNAPNQYLATAEFSNLEEFHQFGRDVDE